ncbi:hypothetical protein AC5_A0219 [Clostridium perfringens CPE str. F4969]|nr:hypothetical protein AC5_A0219 [Clostridium perfringens CPE str. F4969]
MRKKLILSIKNFKEKININKGNQSNLKIITFFNGIRFF